MHRFLTTTLVLLLARAAEATPPKRIAVLEFSTSWGQDCKTSVGKSNQMLRERCEVLSMLADEARAGTLEVLRPPGYVVLTRESTAEFLNASGRTEACAGEGECEVQTARLVNAQYVISGQVNYVEGSWFVALKLHDVDSSALLATGRVDAARKVDLLRSLRREASSMVRRGFGMAEPESTPPPRLPVSTTAALQNAACPHGQIGVDGACCWPGQSYDAAAGQCRGRPSCPEEFTVRGESCVSPCPAGKLPTSGHCCWPGQGWADGQCVGIPDECPDSYHVDVAQQSCELSSCPPGRTRMRDGVHCCWPGQAWVPSKNACVGRPRCPVGFSLVDEGEGSATCIVPECEAGKQRAADDIHCCWPGQAWDERLQRCMGDRTDCPEYTRASPDGDQCVKLRCDAEAMSAQKTCCLPGRRYDDAANLCTGRRNDCRRPLTAVHDGSRCGPVECGVNEKRVWDRCAPRDGCPEDMIVIPGGTWQPAGSASAVTVAPFCLDAVEVTVAAYGACAQRGACVELPNAIDYAGVSPAFRSRASAFCNARRSGSYDHPANCVDADMAAAYCRAEGKRLPTSDEWEWAARGASAASPYPWGMDAPGQRACWKRWTDAATAEGTCPVASLSGGDSPQGVSDLAGNVWEWTSGTQGEKQICRGGSWAYNTPTFLMATSRRTLSPNERREDVGFRCAGTPASPQARTGARN